MKDLPLVVDLDGALIRSNLLVEKGLLFLCNQPYRLPTLLRWLACGKTTLAHELARETEIDVAVLPYDESVVEFIEQERGRGRRVVLATARHRKLAERIAQHLGLFDEVIGTHADGGRSAQAKRDVLVQSFGDRGFDYAGHSRDDLPVWGAARKAYVVNAARATRREAQALGNVAGFFETRGATAQAWAQAFRLHQWLKNLLIFVPLLAAHRYNELPLVIDASLAFLCFGLCASSVYILNDLLDLRDDRHHARKRSRPFASGRLSIQSGLVAFPLLLLAAFGLGIWQLPGEFAAGLAAYYGLTLAYSTWLKRRMVVDVITLAALYTMRIIIGAVTLGIPLSFWLLAFSVFMFLSLALVKRYAELFHLRAQSKRNKARGRGYFTDDLQMIASLGAASGYMAVMVLALYINDARTTQLYRHQQLIWLVFPLLLAWISRVWMLAHRGQMNQDPVIFAVRDRVSLCIGALIALVFWAAT